MRVDEARHERAPSAVDHDRSFKPVGRNRRRGDPLDLVPADEDIRRPREAIALPIEDANVLEHRCSRLLRVGIEAHCQSARQRKEC